jgi:phosphoserine phosphatase
MGAFKDILVLLGKKKEVVKIDKKYQKIKFIGPWGLEKVAELYRGISEEKLKELAFDYCQKKLMKGMKEIVVDLKKKGFIVGALSSNPQFLMDTLKEILPFDFSEGTQLEFKNGKATGKIKKKVDRYRKAEILKEKREEYKIKKENTIVFGGSITDIPMVKEAGVFIGFDVEKETIGEVARMIMSNKDLLKILSEGR